MLFICFVCIALSMVGMLTAMVGIWLGVKQRWEDAAEDIVGAGVFLGVAGLIFGGGCAALHSLWILLGG